MIVKRIFINTYKYDFQFARICIASVRYWYPDIPIYLIKDTGAGYFSTKLVEKKWSVNIFETHKKSFGWGYGKLEPLFIQDDASFLVLDADTVFTGPVVDKVKDIQAQFIVDDEEQPASRFNEIYYNLERINEIAVDFKYPGYSFNSGQWFGTSGIVSREDFAKTLDWTDPPKPKFPDIVFNGDQANLNFVFHLKEQTEQLSISRTKLMIWPNAGNADFLNLAHIKAKQTNNAFVIHWAGMKFKKITTLPRADILQFYKKFYYTKMSKLQPLADAFNFIYLYYEKKANLFFNKITKRSSR